MNIDKLAHDAVTAFAEGLSRGEADALTAAIRARLAESRTGVRALEALQADPSAMPALALATDVLCDELTLDPQFAKLISALTVTPC